MDLKDYLTNEIIRKRFVSQFELVNYAIKLAANMIMTGRDSRVKIDSQNRSMQVLSEILNHKDQFDEIIPEQIEPQFIEKREEPSHSAFPKSTERKKSRKILAE